LNDVANLVFQIHAQYYLATCMTLTQIVSLGRRQSSPYPISVCGVSVSNRFFLTIFKEMMKIVSSDLQHMSHVKTWSYFGEIKNSVVSMLSFRLSLV
jgi:hypothetical protein